MFLLGLSFAALTAELAMLLVLRNKGAEELVSAELAELVISLGLYIVLLVFATYYAPPETSEAARRNVIEAAEALEYIHKKLLSLSFGVAILIIVLTFYLARGFYILPEVLKSYVVDLDRLLSPLSSATSLTGIASALARHTLLLVELGARLRPLFDALLPSLLVYRVRRFAAPVVALLFVLSVITPYALALRLPHIDAPLHFLDAPGSWGFASFRVYEHSGEVMSAPVLVALRDDEGKLFVVRVSHEYTVALPSGNYTAAWAAVYFTRFDVPGCCLDPKPYVYCFCPVWPAVLHLINFSTVSVQVNLPVNIIPCEHGVGGIFTAQRGGAPLPTSRLECGAAVYVEPREDEVAFIDVKAGGYGVVFPNGQVAAGNDTCWYINVSRVDGGGPPGVEIDHELLRRAREGYVFWWNSVREAVAEHFRPFFELGSASTPRYSKYTLMISFHRGACTGDPAQVPFAEIVLQGVCCWNDSHAVPLNPFWDQARSVAGSLPSLIGDLVRLLSLLYNSALMLVFWAGGVLALAGLYVETLPYVARALAGRLARGARLIPLIRLKAMKVEQPWRLRWSFSDEIYYALHVRSSVEKFVLVLRALAVHAARTAASIMGSRAVPLALRGISAASDSIARRARQKEKPTYSQVRRGVHRCYCWEYRPSRAARLAEATSRATRKLYDISTWPSLEHRLRAANATTGTTRRAFRLARVIIPEFYYRALGYRVLLPYSLGYKRLERNFLAPREFPGTKYEKNLAPLVRAYLQEITEEVARNSPWVTSRAEWGELEKILREARRLYELDEAVKILLSMGHDVRKLVAKMTRVAPSPWMENDLSLYLRLRALEEFEKREEPWAIFSKGLLLWNPPTPPGSKPLSLRWKLLKFKRGIKWRLGELDWLG